ncbi:MAG: response regulator transcription factor [Chloroflexota bacterium]|nr:response regulator transcription factor [Dehalococcoidia bacterium]MDW8253075.1 response regulator transcription factor [Chloroflexota bacterium]
MSHRILVIDDDPKILNTVRRGLAYEGYQVDIAGSGEEGLRLAREHAPDLVILDIMLPGLDGFEICRRLRAGGDVPVLMLTARDEVSDRVRGLDLGADDYMVKPFAFEELIARVRALLRRREPSSSGILRYADLTLDPASREVFRGDRPIELTNREFELLSLFMRHPRQVLPRATILERVWDYDFGGDSNVLDVYIGYLRNKLEANGEPRLIHTVRGAGYVLRE